MRDFFEKILKRFRFNPLVKIGLSLTGHELKPDKWVFILGCYNSGTTLLESLLAKHDDIGSLGDEGVILTGHLNRPEDFGWTRMWHTCYDQVKMDESTGEERALNIKKHWSHVFPKRKVLIEKSIVNSTRIPFFNKFFTPTYFIYIVRNGYAVAEGIRRKAKPANYNNKQYARYPIELCARQWQETHTIVMKERSKVEHFLQISYEELCAHPEEALRRCTEFLEISPLSSKAISDTYKIHQHNSSIQNMNQRSFEGLSKEDILAIEAQAKEALAFYQYTRPSQYDRIT